MYKRQTVGEEIEYYDDPNIKCKVVGDRKVEYQGKEMSLTAAAKLISGKKYSIAGPRFRSYLEQFKTKSGIWFLDLREPSNAPMALHGWISPNGIMERLEKDIQAGNDALRAMPYDLLTDKDGLNLREYQVKAIKAAEKAVIDGQKEVLIAMTEVSYAIWLSVAGMLAAWILIKHICTLRLYKTSLPFYNETAEKWLQLHRGFPKAALRRSEFVKSPMTYGVIRPVILLPSEISLNEEEFFCIMEHEWVHIHRKDVFVKYLLCLTICIYWFHPLVWMMAVLLNRDMELACDEEVIRTRSQRCKTAYALALIRLAQESRQSVWPLNACFARHSEIEERIRFIMDKKIFKESGCCGSRNTLLRFGSIHSIPTGNTR